MTKQKARTLIKIGKILIIMVFIMFFAIIVFQSIKINNLKSQENLLSNEVIQKQKLNSEINDKIDSITSNFDSYSEEELRKDNYKKQNETLYTYN